MGDCTKSQTFESLPGRAGGSPIGLLVDQPHTVFGQVATHYPRNHGTGWDAAKVAAVGDVVTWHEILISRNFHVVPIICQIFDAQHGKVGHCDRLPVEHRWLSVHVQHTLGVAQRVAG